MTTDKTNQYLKIKDPYGQVKAALSRGKIPNYAQYNNSRLASTVVSRKNNRQVKETH